MLKKRTLLAYGGFATPLILSEIPILLYLPAFYAQEIGMSTALVGAVFLCARMWDGVSDLLVGWLSDRFRPGIGRRKPWVLAGSPALIITTWFLCNPPANAGLLYLAVWAVLFYTADTVSKIPHLSWGAELSTDYLERSRVTAFRSAFSMLGTLIFVSMPLIFLPRGAPLGDVLKLVSFTVLLMVPLTVVPLVLWVRDPLPPTSSQVRLLNGLIAQGRDRVFLMFVAAVLLYGTANGVINSMAVFSFSTGLQLPDSLFWVIFALYVSTLGTLPVLMRLSPRVEKHRLLAWAMAVLVVAYGVHVFLPAGNLPLVLGLWVIAGIGNAAVLVLPPSMLADIVDRGEIESGEKRSGAYMALYNLTTKIGLALGVGVSFGLLAILGFQPSAIEHSAADVRNIRLVGFGLPALLFLPAIYLIRRYPLGKSAQRLLRERIEARPLSEQGGSA